MLSSSSGWLRVFGGLCVDMWWLVHQWSFLLFWLSFNFFDCFWRLVHCWYSLGRPVTIGTQMVLTVFDDWCSVPIVNNSQKQSKDSQKSKNDHWRTNRHITQSPPNTYSRLDLQVFFVPDWCHCVNVNRIAWSQCHFWSFLKVSKRGL